MHGVPGTAVHLVADFIANYLYKEKRINVFRGV